jgi:hypothetical protein
VPLPAVLHDGREGGVVVSRGATCRGVEGRLVGVGRGGHLSIKSRWSGTRGDAPERRGAACGGGKGRSLGDQKSVVRFKGRLVEVGRGGHLSIKRRWSDSVIVVTADGL